MPEILDSKGNILERIPRPKPITTAPPSVKRLPPDICDGGRLPLWVYSPLVLLLLLFVVVVMFLLIGG